MRHVLTREEQSKGGLLARSSERPKMIVNPILIETQKERVRLAKIALEYEINEAKLAKSRTLPYRGGWPDDI